MYGVELGSVLPALTLSLSFLVNFLWLLLCAFSFFFVCGWLLLVCVDIFIEFRICIEDKSDNGTERVREIESAAWNVRMHLYLLFNFVLFFSLNSLKYSIIPGVLVLNFKFASVWASTEKKERTKRMRKPTDQMETSEQARTNEWAWIYGKWIVTAAAYATVQTTYFSTAIKMNLFVKNLHVFMGQPNTRSRLIILLKSLCARY